MNAHLKTPKLLPWLARKAGITEARAVTLWRDSERWAGHRAAHGTSAYFKLAVDRLLQLAAAESLREDVASFGWRPWARTQGRLVAIAMHAMQQASALTARGWRLAASAGERHQTS